MWTGKPLNYLLPSFQAARIMMESQTVIALRLSGMAGFWAMQPDEANKMVAEKLNAGVESAAAAMRVGMAGGSLSHVAMAAMKPIRRKTRANARRLQRQATTP